MKYASKIILLLAVLPIPAFAYTPVVSGNVNGNVDLIQAGEYRTWTLSNATVTGTVLLHCNSLVLEGNNDIYELAFATDYRAVGTGNPTIIIRSGTTKIRNTRGMKDRMNGNPLRTATTTIIQDGGVLEVGLSQDAGDGNARWSIPVKISNGALRSLSSGRLVADIIGAESAQLNQPYVLCSLSFTGPLVNSSLRGRTLAVENGWDGNDNYTVSDGVIFLVDTDARGLDAQLTQGSYYFQRAQSYDFGQKFDRSLLKMDLGADQYGNADFAGSGSSRILFTSSTLYLVGNDISMTKWGGLTRMENCYARFPQFKVCHSGTLEVFNSTLVGNQIDSFNYHGGPGYLYARNSTFNTRLDDWGVDDGSWPGQDSLMNSLFINMENCVLGNIQGALAFNKNDGWYSPLFHISGTNYISTLMLARSVVNPDTGDAVRGIEVCNFQPQALNAAFGAPPINARTPRLDWSLTSTIAPDSEIVVRPMCNVTINNVGKDPLLLFWFDRTWQGLKVSGTVNIVDNGRVIPSPIINGEEFGWSRNSWWVAPVPPVKKIRVNSDLISTGTF